MKTAVSTERKLWSGAALTALLILLMAPYGRAAEHLAKKYFGKEVFYVFTLFFIVLGVWIFFRYVFQSRDRRLQRITKFLLVSSFYTWRLVTLNVHVERFHLIEYGILSALVCLAALRHKQGWASLGWGFTASWLIGIADEFFQWWWPTRVGEWRDVLLNIQSGALGLAALMLLMSSKLSFGRPSRKSVVILLLVCALLSALSGAFILKVHVFGYRHADLEIGFFFSMFMKNELLEVTEEKYLDLVQRAGGHQSDRYITDLKLYFYEREAKEHFDRVHLLVELNRLPEAASEYDLMLRYYSPWMRGTGTFFSPDIDTLLKQADQADPASFTSPVFNWIMVSVTRDQAKNLSITLCALFLLAAAIILFRLL